jgi:hypothetical protein
MQKLLFTFPMIVKLQPAEKSRHHVIIIVRQKLESNDSVSYPIPGLDAKCRTIESLDAFEQT